jgi:hypothetical protein
MKKEIIEIIKGNVMTEYGISEEEARKFAEKTAEKIEVGGEIVGGIVAGREQEIRKFIRYAKGEGTKLTIGELENGIMAAGRTDMQNGLAEILNGMKIEAPVCGECGEKLEDLGRSKKK